MTHSFQVADEISHLEAFSRMAALEKHGTYRWLAREARLLGRKPDFNPTWIADRTRVVMVHPFLLLPLRDA
jgi:hypothetical protein